MLWCFMSCQPLPRFRLISKVLLKYENEVFLERRHKRFHSALPWQVYIHRRSLIGLRSGNDRSNMAKGGESTGKDPGSLRVT